MIKGLRILSLILALGLIAAVAVSLFTCVVREPAITEHDFPYSVTYQLNGEIHTLEGVYRCRFTSTGEGSEPLFRYYAGSYLTNNPEYQSGSHTIAEKDGLELCVVTVLFDRFLMGDTEGEPDGDFLYDPYLAVRDREGMEYVDEDMLGRFDAELIRWEMPEPVENEFVFVGFSHLHDDSMFAMLVVGILVIVATMIFVKRNPEVTYKLLDKFAIAANFVLVLAVIPVLTGAIWISQIAVKDEEFFFQVALCIPAIVAFTVSASIALRRNGFRKSGFFIQFAGLVLLRVILFFG